MELNKKRNFYKLIRLLVTAALLVVGLSMQPEQNAQAGACVVNRTTGSGLGDDWVNDVFASGINVYAATEGGLSISTNGGSVYTNRTTADGLGDDGVNDVFVSGSNVYAATDGGLSISTDSGANFVNRTTVDGLGNNAVFGVFVSGSNVYAATAGGLSISTDGGANFNNRDTTDGLGHNFIRDVFVSGNTVYAATAGGISISTDGGANFDNYTTVDGLGANDTFGIFVSNGTIYASVDASLSISTDGGTNWTNMNTGDGLGSNIVFDAFVSGSNVYVATDGGMSASSDEGNAFVNFDSGDGLGADSVNGVYENGGIVYAATEGGLTIFYCSPLPPTVVKLKGNGTTKIVDGGTYALNATKFTVEYNILEINNFDPADPDSATNPDNYYLFQSGVNTTYDFTSCNDGTPGDDVFITIDNVTYDVGGKTATLNINSGVPLPYGDYRLLVCGTTSITSTFGTTLNLGEDEIVNFTLILPTAPASLPATGFTPGIITALPEQTADKTYANLGDLWLDIPSLDVQMEIVGVLQDGDGWDTTWLGQSAGWLNGSAFPTWEGNTVLTGHVWDSWNQAGPFRNLRQLDIGDQFYIHAYGSVYTYEVIDSNQVYPDDVASVFEHSDYDMVTLVTCESYSLWTGGYRYRRAVSAVLVDINAE